MPKVLVPETPVTDTVKSRWTLGVDGSSDSSSIGGRKLDYDSDDLYLCFECESKAWTQSILAKGREEGADIPCIYRRADRQHIFVLA
ncbi:hypothetical protein B7463_g7379, partial [Scytalidium lignicola]